MATAEVNGAQLYYEIHGDGHPLLLIGGLSSDSATWSLILENLKKCFKVIIFDNRGAGRTKDSGGPFDIGVMAKDSVMLLDRLKIEKATILGHSMGGYIAQEAAITYPERVERLILESTSAETSERNKFLFTNLIKLYENDSTYEVFLKEFMVWLFTPEYFNDKKKRDEFINYILSYPHRQSPEDFKRQVEAYTGYSSTERLEKIQAETLVLSGEKDMLITPEETSFLASRIANAEMKYIAGAAHSIQTESPEKITEEIHTWRK